MRDPRDVAAVRMEEEEVEEKRRRRRRKRRRRDRALWAGHEGWLGMQDGQLAAIAAAVAATAVVEVAAGI